MPYFRVTITDPDLSSDLQRAIAQGLTQLAVSVLRKSGARTTVQINLVPADSYFVDGQPVAGGLDAHVEGTITLGSTGSAERAVFLAKVHALLSDVLGPLPRAGVALYELSGESYGYNGITQFDHYSRAAS